MRLGAGAELAVSAQEGSSLGSVPLRRRSDLCLRTRAVGGRLPLPSKDDVALVDGRPTFDHGLSRAALRSQLKNRSTAAVLWAGTAALAIQNATRARGAELETPAAVALAQYALGEIGADQADTRSAAALLLRAGRPAAPTPTRSARRSTGCWPRPLCGAMTLSCARLTSRRLKPKTVGKPAP